MILEKPLSIKLWKLLDTAESEEIIWSAQTITHDPGTLGNLADDFAKVIAEELDEEKLLKKEGG